MKTLLLTLLTASLTLSALGQESKYQKVRKMNDLSDKKRFVLAMDREDQSRAIWRPHFAYVLITETLTPEQQEFLVSILEAFEAGDMTDEIETEAGELFGKELGRRVFIPGPYSSSSAMCVSFKPRPPYAFGFAPKFSDCDCRQTGTNWSCSAYCDASSCQPTPSGCSIFFAYPCDGRCSGSTKG